MVAQLGLKLKSVLLNSLSPIWRHYRHKIYTKKINNIEKWGLENGYEDKRSKIQRVCDWIDTHFKKEEEMAIDCYNHRKFKPYFDISLGIRIESPEQIKKIEKEKGGEWVSVSEWERIKSAKDKRTEQAHLDKLEGQIKFIQKEVGQGRKFTQEMRQRRESAIKEIRRMKRQ